MALRPRSSSNSKSRVSSLLTAFFCLAILIPAGLFTGQGPAQAGDGEAVILDVAHLVTTGGGLEIASQNAVGLDETGFVDLRRAVIVQGTGLPSPVKVESGGAVELSFGKTSVRGGGFLLPVFRPPVEFIEAVECDGSAKVIVRLSHRADHEVTTRSGAVVLSIGSPGAEIPESDRNSGSSSAAASLQQSQPVPGGNDPGAASDSAGNSLPKPGDDGELRPRLKDVDIVERDGFDGIEVRLKFSKEPGFRTISLPGSHVIMVPRATLEYAKPEIQLNRRGIKAVTFRETEGFLRIVASLQGDPSVKVEESGRRIRLFVTPGLDGAAPKTGRKAPVMPGTPSTALMAAGALSETSGNLESGPGTSASGFPARVPGATMTDMNDAVQRLAARVEKVLNSRSQTGSAEEVTTPVKGGDEVAANGSAGSDDKASGGDSGNSGGPAFSSKTEITDIELLVQSGSTYIKVRGSGDLTPSYSSGRDSLMLRFKGAQFKGDKKKISGDSRPVRWVEAGNDGLDTIVQASLADPASVTVIPGDGVVMARLVTEAPVREQPGRAASGADSSHSFPAPIDPRQPVSSARADRSGEPAKADGTAPASAPATSGTVRIAAKEFTGPEDPDAALSPEDRDRKALLSRLEKLIASRRAAIVKKVPVLKPASTGKEEFPTPAGEDSGRLTAAFAGNQALPAAGTSGIVVPLSSAPPAVARAASSGAPEALVKNAEAILRLAEDAAAPADRGLVQVRSSDRIFLGIPLDKGASHRTIATGNQLIIEVRNSSWRAPWTFKRLAKPMKFARAISKGKGFTLIVAFDGSTCTTPDVEVTDGGLSVVLSADVLGDEIAGTGADAMKTAAFSENAAETRTTMDDVRAAAAEASKAVEATKVLEAVASQADPARVLSITKEEWASGAGLAKLKACETGDKAAPSPASAETAVKSDAAGPSNGESPSDSPKADAVAASGPDSAGPAPAIVRNGGPRPIMPRDGVFAMTPPPGEGFVRMTGLKLDDLVGGKRLTAQFESPVKARLIKARSQAIVTFEKAWYSGSDPVRMVFDDPVKVVRLSTGRQDLKAIVVLTMDADVRLRNEGNTVVVEVLGLTDKQRKAVTELSTLGRRRIARRREDVLKRHLTPVPDNDAGSAGLFGPSAPVEGGLSGVTPEGIIAVRTPSGDELSVPDDLTREQLKERLLAMANPESGIVSEGAYSSAYPPGSGMGGPGMFGSMDPVMEYADSASIERSLADAERKARARELYLNGLSSAERGDWIAAASEYTESLKLVAGDVNVIRALNIATPRKEAQELFRDGNDFAASDEWQKAVWAYSEAMRKDASQPKYSFAWEAARKTAAVMTLYEESMGQYKDGQYGKAIEGLRQVAEARPGWMKGIIALGRAYEGRKWYKAAVMTYAKAIEIEPNNSEALAALDLARKRLRVQEIYRIGKSLEEAGKFEDAAAEYRKALSLEEEFRRLSGDREQTYMEEAKKLYDQGRLEDALGLSEKAIKVRPEDVEAHYWKAKALMGLGRITEAVVEFKKVVELDPKNSREIPDLMM